MRPLALILGLSLLLSGCVQLVTGHTKVYGAATTVSLRDIQSVVEAFEAKGRDRSLKAYQIHVISSDEMHVYWYQEPIPGGHWIYRRRGDDWHYDGQVIVTS